MPDILFADTSALYALLNAQDAFHARVKEIFLSEIARQTKIITSNFVVDETTTLLRYRAGFPEAEKFLDIILKGEIAVIHVDTKLESKAIRIFKAYKDKAFSFTDCTSFALVDTYKINKTLSFDSDFRKYRFKKYVAVLS